MECRKGQFLGGLLIAAPLLGSALVLLGPAMVADGALDQVCRNPRPPAWHGLESQGQVSRLDAGAPRLAKSWLRDQGAPLARRRPKKDEGEIVVARLKR
jgi:hypothetical protein